MPITVEIWLSAIAVGVWLVVMWRFRSDIKKLRPGEGTGGIIVLIIIWTTLISLLVRALFNNGVLPQEIVVFTAAVARGLFIISGLALVFWAKSAKRQGK